LHTESADLVVLANTPIEAVRLSLRSGIGTAPDERAPTRVHASATDPSGLLGRNLMFHLQTVVYAVFNQELHPWRGRTSTHTLDEMAGSGPGSVGFDPTVPRGGIVEIGGNSNPIFEATTMTAVASHAKLKQILRLSPFRRHLAAFTLQGEDMPQIDNYVDLDPDVVDVFGEPAPRITYHHHRYGGHTELLSIRSTARAHRTDGTGPSTTCTTSAAVCFRRRPDTTRR